MITNEVLQQIAGTIEALLIEQQEGIAFAFGKIPEGIKVTIGIDLDKMSQGLEVNYTVNYPLESAPEPAQKQKVKKREIINGNQAAFDEFVDSVRSGEVTDRLSTRRHS